MKEIGEEKVYDELVFVPGEIYVRRHIVKKYKCKKCGQNPKNDALNSDDIEQQKILHLLLHFKSHKLTKKHIRINNDEEQE